MGARPAASSSLYIPGLDGMRAIAFFFVFVAHAQPFKALPGGFGVTIFFFQPVVAASGGCAHWTREQSGNEFF